MAALPVLVPGTRMCCLTSGGGPGRLAALQGLVCSRLVPPDPEGTGLGWGLLGKRVASVCVCAYGRGQGTEQDICLHLSPSGGCHQLWVLGSHQCLESSFPPSFLFLPDDDSPAPS